MDELTKRNFQALSQGLKDERRKNEALAIKVTQLEGTIAMMQNHVNAILPQIAYLKAQSYGSGATA